MNRSTCIAAVLALAGPVGGTSADFAAYLKAEIAKWAVVVKASGAKPE